jgi:O-antigen ligase
MGIAVVALALWVVGTNFLAHPYNSTAQYHAAFLLGGFLYGRRASSIAGTAFAVAEAFAVALATWALWQRYAGEARAHGVFITPGTFAATINFLLLPTLVIVALGSRRPALLAALGVLALAIVASTSRGGWLALAGAAAMTMVFIRRAELPIRRRALAMLVGSLGVALLLAVAWSRASLGAQAAASFQSRLELYQLALTGATPSTWLFGAGYDAFYYLLEGSRALVPTYAGVTTYFVHNDYLQTLYAFGIPGLTALLYLVVSPLMASWRTLPELLEGDRRAVIAVLAATASMALHALVDFPFFVPLCVLLYGGALGILDATLMKARHRVEAVERTPGWTRGVTAAILTLAVWVLAVPLAAEAAAAYAQMQWRKGDAQRAAYWFEAARRIDARDWRYHWYAGQFWTAHAAVLADPRAARHADVALAAAISANPREVRALYSRIELHTRLRAILATPADLRTVREWADRAVALAPTDGRVRAERERVFKEFPPG